jgi:hypothetical protein
MRPTNRKRLAERQKVLESQLAQVNQALALPHILLPCGCKVQLFNHHGIKVIYCQRHESFVFSPRHDGSDVFYFVTEEQKP